MHLSQLLRLVRSGKALAAEATGLGRAPQRETPSQRPRLVVRVLIAHEDARIRDAYRRILLETDVNHDIAAFRELRSRAAHTAESVYSRASSFRRTRSFEVTCCGRAEEAVALAQEAAIQQRPFAVAFIGVRAGDCSGTWAAASIRKADPAVEIVLCTGRSAIDPLEFGGLVPPEDKLSHLASDSAASEVRQMIIALASKWLAERRVVRLAYFDALTELPNREQFRSRLSSAIETARQQSRLLALLYLDLDRFKGVNTLSGTLRVMSCCAQWPIDCGTVCASRMVSARAAPRSAAPGTRRDSAAMSSPPCCPIYATAAMRSRSRSG